MDQLSRIGRSFYGVATVGFGLLHVATGDFVTRVVPSWPGWIPGRSLWAYAIGGLLIASGAAMLMNRGTRVVATWLGAALLLSFTCLGLPLAAADAILGGRWTWAGKALALSGGAFLVARAAFELDSPAIAGRGVRESAVTRLGALGPWFFGAFLALCGIQHFVHVDFVTTLVPTWIPGARVWTYATGTALIAGGVGLVVPRTAWLAGLLSGGMILVWVLILHVPRALNAAPGSTNETTAVFEALAMSGIAWLAAAQAWRGASRPVRLPAASHLITQV